MATAPAAENARERILDAACDLIAEQGIDAVRIARVAAGARVSTALVHHYFSTREELLAEALRHSYEQAGEERFGGEPLPGDSAATRLAAAIEECLPLPGAQEREWVLWVELWLRAVREPELRPVAAELYGRYHDWIADVLAAGAESGAFAPRLEVGELADIVVALIDGAGVRALIGDPGMDLARVTRLLEALLAAELGVEPSELQAALTAVAASRSAEG